MTEEGSTKARRGNRKYQMSNVYKIMDVPEVGAEYTANILDTPPKQIAFAESNFASSSAQYNYTSNPSPTNPSAVTTSQQYNLNQQLQSPTKYEGGTLASSSYGYSSPYKTTESTGVQNYNSTQADRGSIGYSNQADTSSFYQSQPNTFQVESSRGSIQEKFNSYQQPTQQPQYFSTSSYLTQGGYTTYNTPQYSSTFSNPQPTFNPTSPIPSSTYSSWQPSQTAQTFSYSKPESSNYNSGTSTNAQTASNQYSSTTPYSSNNDILSSNLQPQSSYSSTYNSNTFSHPTPSTYTPQTTVTAQTAPVANYSSLPSRGYSTSSSVQSNPPQDYYLPSGQLGNISANAINLGTGVKTYERSENNGNYGLGTVHGQYSAGLQPSVASSSKEYSGYNQSSGQSGTTGGGGGFPQYNNQQFNTNTTNPALGTTSIPWNSANQNQHLLAQQLTFSLESPVHQKQHSLTETNEVKRQNDGSNNLGSLQDNRNEKYSTSVPITLTRVPLEDAQPAQITSQVIASGQDMKTTPVFHQANQQIHPPTSQRPPEIKREVERKLPVADVPQTVHHIQPQQPIHPLPTGNSQAAVKEEQSPPKLQVPLPSNFKVKTPAHVALESSQDHSSVPAEPHPKKEIADNLEIKIQSPDLLHPGSGDSLNHQLPVVGGIQGLSSPQFGSKFTHTHNHELGSFGNESPILGSPDEINHINKETNMPEKVKPAEVAQTDEEKLQALRKRLETTFGGSKGISSANSPDNKPLEQNTEPSNVFSKQPVPKPKEQQENLHESNEAIFQLMSPKSNTNDMNQNTLGSPNLYNPNLERKDLKQIDLQPIKVESISSPSPSKQSISPTNGPTKLPQFHEHSQGPSQAHPHSDIPLHNKSMPTSLKEIPEGSPPAEPKPKPHASSELAHSQVVQPTTSHYGRSSTQTKHRSRTPQRELTEDGSPSVNPSEKVLSRKNSRSILGSLQPGKEQNTKQGNVNKLMSNLADLAESASRSGKNISVKRGFTGGAGDLNKSGMDFDDTKSVKSQILNEARMKKRIEEQFPNTDAYENDSGKSIDLNDMQANFAQVKKQNQILDADKVKKLKKKGSEVMDERAINHPPTPFVHGHTPGYAHAPESNLNKLHQIQNSPGMPLRHNHNNSNSLTGYWSMLFMVMVILLLLEVFRQFIFSNSN
jgi:hypothetical protein